MSEVASVVVSFGVLQLVLLLGVALALARLIRGPTLPDRVVALEVVGAAVVAVLLVRAVDRDQPILVDVAIVVALVSFVTALGFARYIDEARRDG